MFISIISPIFNEEKNIIFFYKKIKKTIKKIKSIKKYEIVFGNNASTDKSLNKIKQIIKKDKKVKVVSLRKNYGKNLNVLAALKASSGDIIFILDIDCQDPPEMLEIMIKKYNKSFSNIVYGYRAYENEKFFMKFLRNYFYRFLNFFSSFKIIPNLAEYILISKKNKNRILNSKYSFPFLRIDIAFHKFKCTKIKYERTNRTYGKSNYNYFNLFKILLISSISCSYFGVKYRFFNKKTKINLDLRKSIF